MTLPWHGPVKTVACTRNEYPAAASTTPSPSSAHSARFLLVHGGGAAGSSKSSILNAGLHGGSAARFLEVVAPLPAAYGGGTRPLSARMLASSA